MMDFSNDFKTMLQNMGQGALMAATGGAVTGGLRATYKMLTRKRGESGQCANCRARLSGCPECNAFQSFSLFSTCGKCGTKYFAG